MEKESLKIEAGKPKKIGKIGAGLIPVIGLIVVAVIGLEVPKIPIRATETAEAKHTQASITQTFVAPSQTLEPTPTSTQVPTTSFSPMEVFPTETKVLLTPTDYIYDQSISIGYIGHANEDNPKIKETLTSLGFTVGKVFLDYYDENDDQAVYQELLKYDVVFFPAGWSRYNFEINDYRSVFADYVSSGRGIFVQEANSEIELTTVFLPFDVEFISSNPHDQDLEAEILDSDHFIFGNLKNKTFDFIPGDSIRNYDDFIVLAQGRITKQPSLLLSKFHQGRIVIFLSDITEMEVSNQNSTLIKNMFNWLNGGVE